MQDNPFEQLGTFARSHYTHRGLDSEYILKPPLTFISLSRRKLAGVNNLVCIFHVCILVGSEERRAWKSHQSCSRGFKDTERSDKFEERVNPSWLRGPVMASELALMQNLAAHSASTTYTSTMQLLVLISSTLPPN